MSTGKISSSTISAQEAISKLTGIDASQGTNQTVEFSGSTATGMLNGQKAANALLSDLSNLANCVLKQANKFPKLAEAIEVRDHLDAKKFK